ncbi:cytochrome P450 monooxygenase [Fusarium bulbicola]|nr:cytochrome P450 monooxygenase [Fusarium bulbicola]
MDLNKHTTALLAGQYPLGGAVLVAVAALVLLMLIAPKDRIPVINKYPNDWCLSKAHMAFITNADGLIKQGFAKFNKPFRMITLLGDRIVLPADHFEWMRRHGSHLDHQPLVSKDFFAGYPGFDGTAAMSDPSKLLANVIKKKLVQNPHVSKLHNMVQKDLVAAWPGQSNAKIEWKAVDWAKDGVSFISRMSASVFVGEELSRDETWQQVSTNYGMTVFLAARALRAWPRFLRPIVQWFLPACKSCRAAVQRARQVLQKNLAKRAAEGKEHDDSITWFGEIAGGKSYDPVAAQLGMSMAAVVTTSELVKQTIIEICAHDLATPLREEIEAVIAEHGWSPAALTNMRLLDINLDRQVLSPVTLPNGQHLPKGTAISIYMSQLRNPEVYENPETFDAYRYVKLRAQGGKWIYASSATSTSEDHFVFGIGKPICPGRFFAIAEIKTAVASILLDYDLRLAEGYTPKLMPFGFELFADPGVQLELVHEKVKQDDRDSILTWDGLHSEFITAGANNELPALRQVEMIGEVLEEDDVEMEDAEGEPGEAAEFDLAPNEGNLLALENANECREIISRIPHRATDWKPLAEALEVDEPLTDDLVTHLHRVWADLGRPVASIGRQFWQDKHKATTEEMQQARKQGPQHLIRRFGLLDPDDVIKS